MEKLKAKAHWIDFLKNGLIVEQKTLWVYMVFYFCWGIGMHFFGDWAQIARFTYWWQVITVYILYMVPISLVLRQYHWFTQYAYGVIAMGILEFGGYALQTSIAFDNNLLDQFFGIRNFSLGMTLFFGAYFPLGNWVVHKIAAKL